MRKTLAALVLATTGVISIHSAAQSAKTKTKQTPKETTTSRHREIPTIKCDDLDSMAACKSFRQLVVAKDEDVLSAVLGKRSPEDTHIAYVCFEPKVDRFRIIDFDQPSDQHFFKHPRACNDSPYCGLYSVVPFLNAKRKPVSTDVLTAWFADYSDFYLYSYGRVEVISYQNGLLSDVDGDSGNWSKAIDSVSRSKTFEGAYYWLADYDRKNNDKFLRYDDTENPHIAADESTIDVSYDFDNASAEITHYHMLLQRSTGRFTQSFSTDSIPAQEESGSCSVFK